MLASRGRPYFFALIIAATTALLAASPAHGDVEAELESLMNEAGFTERMDFAVAIIDGETGELLAAHNERKALIPASNMKLLTSGAALRVLGPEFEFVTELLLERGAGPNGANRLIVRGSGDPAFGDFELLDDMGLTIEDFLSVWVDAIADSGRANEVGEIVIDDRVFDRMYVHSSWPRDQLNKWYCAEVSGVNFHANVLRVYTRAGEVGERPGITFEPEMAWLDIGNKARSVGRGKNHTVWASRAHNTNRITLHGDVRRSSMPIEVTVHDPGLIFGRVLADRLRARGHTEPAVRLVGADEEFEGAEIIHRVRTPLAVALERCNKSSHNLYAEALSKRVGAEVGGAPGTWTRAAFAVRAALIERVGTDLTADFIIADGSGMSRENRASALGLARWLEAIDDDAQMAPHFRESLPTAGEEGTLRKRFSRDAPQNEVRAKTGYLRGITALSGYVTSRSSGHTYVFSIISNNKPGNVPLSAVRQLEEEIVMMLDDELILADQQAALGG